MCGNNGVELPQAWEKGDLLPYTTALPDTWRFQATLSPGMLLPFQLHYYSLGVR